MAIAKRPPSESEVDPWDAHSGTMTWATAILVAIISLIVLGVLIIWLAVHPRQLQYAVDDAFVSNFILTDSRLVTAEFDVTISAFNPNRQVSFYYDSMKVSVRSQSHTLASTNGPRLFLSKDNLTNFEVTLVSRNVTLTKSTSRDLRTQQQAGDIKIDVIIEGIVQFKAQHWKKDRCNIRIFCSEVAAHISPQQAFKQTKCDVEL